MNKKLVIFGTGEIGRLAHFYFTHDSEYDVVAFVADDEYVDTDSFQGLPIYKLSKMKEKFPSGEYSAHVALSYNKLNQTRKERYLEIKGFGYEMASYVCSKSFFWHDLDHGDNCFILENQTIQPSVKIGNNVMIWSGNHLGHCCQIKDHAYLASHICISGFVEIGESCFIGVNCAFKDLVKIGQRVFVTMGANVVSDIEDDAVVMPARGSVLGKDSEFGQKIRKKYFNL